MRSLMAAVLLSGLTGGCMTRSSIPDDPSERLSTQTVIYVEIAASIDRFAIESSRLALEQSQSPDVRGFAALLIADHARMERELEAAGQTVRPAKPAFALVSHHYAMLERLRAAGADFDPLYRDFQVAVHQEAVELQRLYAAGGNVIALQNLAQRTLPVSEAHLSQAQALPVPPTPVPFQAPPASPAPPPPGGFGERG